MFQCWLNTRFIEGDGPLRFIVLELPYLDKACKDTKGRFPSDFRLELFFEKVEQSASITRRNLLAMAALAGKYGTEEEGGEAHDHSSEFM